MILFRAARAAAELEMMHPFTGDESSKRYYQQVTPLPVQCGLLCISLLYLTGSVLIVTLLFEMRSFV